MYSTQGRNLSGDGDVGGKRGSNIRKIRGKLKKGSVARKTSNRGKKARKRPISVSICVVHWAEKKKSYEGKRSSPANDEGSHFCKGATACRVARLMGGKKRPGKFPWDKKSLSVGSMTAALRTGQGVTRNPVTRQNDCSVQRPDAFFGKKRNVPK